MPVSLPAGNPLNHFLLNQPTALPNTALTDFDPSRLAEIHLPDAIHFWPIATGWWLLLAVIIVAMLFMIIRKNRKQALSPRKTSIKTLAQRELQVIARNFRQNSSQQHNSQQNKRALNTLKQLSIFLRRYVLSLTARENVAALTDGKWLEYLDRFYADNPSKQSLFSKRYANLLQEGPYKSTVDKENTALIEQLITELEQLIAENNQSSTNTQTSENHQSSENYQSSKKKEFSENHNMSVTTHETAQKTDSQPDNPSPEVKNPEVGHV
jgi:hypothetical protein